MSMTIDQLKEALNSEHGYEVTPEPCDEGAPKSAAKEPEEDMLFPTMTNERLGVDVSGFPESLAKGDSRVQSRQSKINAIEMFESTHPARGPDAIKYPAGCGYQRGDSLANLTDEQLDKVIGVQRCITSSRQMSVIGATLIVQLSKLVEGYVASLDGYSNNLANNLTELQEVLQEILLDNSDSIPEINSPYVKLAMILGISGISTYAANKNKEQKAGFSKNPGTGTSEDESQKETTSEMTDKIAVAATPSPYCGTVMVEQKPKRKYVRKVPTKKEAEKMRALNMTLEQVRALS